MTSKHRHTMWPTRVVILLTLAGMFGSYSAIAEADQSGTGFAIGNGSSVITNFHVVEGCESIHIANVGDSRIKTVDPRNDIAIIQPPRPLTRSLPLRTGDPPKLGEDIIVIGFPLRGLLSSAPTVTTGIVSSLAGLHDDRTRVQISAPVQPGNSGGPVLDNGGNVIGMVVSKLNVLRVAPLIGDIPQNVNFAIPVSIIASTLASNSIPYQVGTFGRQRTVSEVTSAASPAVVAIECLAKESPGRSVGVPIPSPTAPVPSLSPGYYGAIAWDEATGTYGSSWNQATAQRAADVALSKCGSTGCKVVIRPGRRECAALATTESGKYAGGAARRDKDAARLAALTNCKKGNAGECTVRVTDCNK